MANSWGGSGTTWGQGDWGQQDITTIHPTGLSITSSLGDPLSYNETGWGRSTWGSDDWGDFSLTVVPTGYSITGSLGTAVASSLQGWGRNSWGAGPWGESNSPVVSLTGYSITASLGTLAYAQSEEGWGRDEWGTGNWGQNTTTVLPSGLEMTGHQGPDAWGQAPWNEMIGWGGDLRFETTQLSIAALTGIEATASLGTPTISRLDMIFDITGPAAMGAGLGVPNINNGADHSQGVGSLLATMSLGTPIHEMKYALTGLEITASLGALEITSTELIPITDSLLVTGSVGSVTVTDMAIGVSGYSITGSVGAIAPDDMVIGLTGFSATASVNSTFSILGYKDIDITGNTSYSNVDITGYTSYTDVDHVG